MFSADEDVRKKTREVFLTTDVFIVTIGISELWFDEITGGVFWRAVPKGAFDATRHKFRVASVAESVAAIVDIHRLIRANSAAEVVFTLSPVPLIATFRDQSCLTANAASKAILRAAFDEFFRTPAARTDAKCRYFPAYEAVTTQFPSIFDDDWHHPHQFVIDAIMQIFEAYYCETALPKIEAERNFREARARSARWAARSPDFTDRAIETDPNLERARREIAHLREAYAAAQGIIETLDKAKSVAEEAFRSAHRSAVESARDAETLRAALAGRAAGRSA